MKKQYSKEKFIGLPPTHKSSENNSFADLSALLDSPTKTPRKEAKTVGFSLTNLRDRRDFKKTAQLSAEPTNDNCTDNNNKLPMQTSDLIEELEILQDKVRTESFSHKTAGISSPLIHKKNTSVHLAKLGTVVNNNTNSILMNIPGGFQSARSNFGANNNRELKSNFSKRFSLFSRY